MAPFNWTSDRGCRHTCHRGLLDLLYFEPGMTVCIGFLNDILVLVSEFVIFMLFYFGVYLVFYEK